MKNKAYTLVLPATLIFTMVALIGAIFFASANLSFAATGKKGSAAIARPSAVDRTEARIKQLQDALKITEAQETLWNNLTTVMRDNAKEMDALSKSRAENTKTMNAVEHMKFHSQVTEAHLAQLEKFIPPFEALYTSMSDEQKSRTDKIFQSGISGKSPKAKRK